MPSHILVDQPAAEPALGFQAYARALTNVITDSDPQFAVGIFGPWGCGKTTLMGAIKSGLDPNTAIPCDFSAWRYEGEEHLIVPLLDTLREGLLEWAQGQGDAANAAKDAASTVGKVIQSIIAGLSFKMGVPGAIELSFEANKALEQARAPRRDDGGEDARVPRSFYHAAFRALRSSFEAVVGCELPDTSAASTCRRRPKRRIVVFVDDLDRCLPKSALEVIESLKLFFDHPASYSWLVLIATWSKR